MSKKDKQVTPTKKETKAEKLTVQQVSDIVSKLQKKKEKETIKKLTNF